MAGFVYNPAEFEKFSVEIVDKDGSTKTFKIPLFGHIPQEIVDYSDARTDEKIKEVQAYRDELNEKHRVISAADPKTQYPTNQDSLDWMLEMINPDLAEIIATWPYGSRNQIWIDWQDASKISLGKSKSSDNSSDATE